MTTITGINIEGSLSHRLRIIGLPHHMINPLTELFVRWVANSGEEWTAKRFKALKVDLIRQLAGLPSAEPGWIRKNRKGQYYGVIGSLFRWCMDSSRKKPSVKRFNLVLQALNCYTILESKEATSSQLRKFKDGVQHVHDVDIVDLVTFSESVQEAMMNYIPSHLRSVRRVENHLSLKNFSPNKRAPRPHGLGSVPQDFDPLAEVQLFQPNSPYWSFGWKYNALFQPVTAGLVGPHKKPDPLDVDEKLFGGEVHYLQEPGYKLRAIASPYRIYQCALEPLASAIYDIVKVLPWDCTKDQTLAIPYVQQHLSRSNTVHSIDLSGATDYFPLEMQSTALRTIYGDLIDIELFEEVSRMPWKSEHGEITWKTGQPLGLRPSFASFTMTHGLLLYHLNDRRHDNEFFVVGDDVVILNDQLADRYRSWLENNRCPFSPEKSLSSNSIAEFAGKVIYSNGVIPQYKWRKTSNDNFLDLCRNLGPRSRSLLTKQQRQVFDIVKHMPAPTGLNFSYPGSNLTKMIIDSDKILRNIERASVRSLVDLSRRLVNVIYKSPSQYSIDPEWIRERCATFDVKVVKTFSQTVVRRWDLIVLMNDLPEALGIEPRLPLESYQPSRLTSLERYRKLLRLTE